jgi:DNA-binding MarR family transcriptional regulator
MKVSDLAKNIVEFYEKISSWEHAVVKESGLTPAQMHTIEIVGHSEKIRMKDLAEKMGVTTGTLTVSVDKLEKKNLLKRVPHESDRRSYMIVLSDEGNNLFKEHHKLHIQMTSELVNDMSLKEQKVFNSLIEKAIQNI